MSTVKQVIAVRADLGMSRGKMAAQACHAAVGALRHVTLHPYGDACIALWAETGETTVVLQVDSEIALLTLSDMCSEMNLPHHLVRDEGRTEFGGIPTLTCLGVGPFASSTIDAVTGTLKTFR